MELYDRACKRGGDISVEYRGQIRVFERLSL